MKRLGLALLLLASPLAAVDTVIFTEACASNPIQSLNASTSVTVGTSWGARISLDGSPTTAIRSNTADCTAQSAADLGLGYIAAPNPTTDIYFADFKWIDLGAVGATAAIGMLVNYIDVNNYYVCMILDDATTGVTRLVKVSGGVGSTLATGTQGTVPTNKIIECKIDYSGANPTITFRNATDSLNFLSATDSSSPLTKTKVAGVMAGATPQSTNDDADNNLAFDTFRVVEVSAAAAGRPRPPWFGRAF